MWIYLFPVFLVASVSGLDSFFTDSLLRDVLGLMRDDSVGSMGPDPLLGRGKAFEARREPAIRDQEYLEHSSLFGNPYSEGTLNRHKPTGGLMNLPKPDLPGYCNPPNPCPQGYTREDGCLDDFVNSASFSREYQANQKCMCDSEHMFDCPGSTRENEIDALARTFENKGLEDEALNRVMKFMEPSSPFLQGEKLPVVAKKAPIHQNLE